VSTVPARPADPELSIYRRLDPEVLADPYPLYRRLRGEDPVHWDSYLHSWVVTRYADALHVLQHFRASRMPSPEQLTEIDLGELSPIARVLVRQMLFLDPPRHTRIRALAAGVFTPARVERLKMHIQEIVDGLIDRVALNRGMDVIGDLAVPLPAIVTVELMGVPVADRDRLKDLSLAFSEMLGNFQHNPGHAAAMLETVEELTSYYRARLREQDDRPCEGVVRELMTATVSGDRLTEEEVIANSIITMVGGLETTTNLIGNGLLSLLRNPDELARLRANPSLLPSAVEELLRFESPIQHTARLAPEDLKLGGRWMREHDAVIAVIGAANHDPERFPDPDRLDLGRPDNRHLAFGWGGHYCFGAPLARMEAQIVFRTILERFPRMSLETGLLRWRSNMIFRGLEALPVKFAAAEN
jgi:pimeloyl-[acyl-carrier protein] synthase